LVGEAAAAEMNNPAAEQRGISKCIERTKGRGITPGEIKFNGNLLILKLNIDFIHTL
jgi:hypothetical protein